MTEPTNPGSTPAPVSAARPSGAGRSSNAGRSNNAGRSGDAGSSNAGRSRQRWPWITGGLVVAAAGAYAALAATTAGSTPKDTVISGVEVGGLDRAAAEAKLRAGLSDKAAAAVPIVFGDKRIALNPSAAGLKVDYAGSLDGLTGFSLNPADIVAKLRGNVTRTAEIVAPTDVIAGVLRGQVSSVDVAPTDATITITDAQVVTTPAADGVTVDVPKTASAVADGWLRSARITGVTSVTPPEVTDEEVAAVKAGVADKVLAGPITLSVDGQSFDVPAADLVAAVSFPVKDGAPVGAYDNKLLVAAVRKAGLAADVLKRGKDASVTSPNGTFEVVPAVDGLDVDGPSAVAAVKKAITSPERTADVTSKPAPAKFTTAQAKATIPEGVISTFTTNFPYNPDRTHNITLATNTLNGTYVAPGAQFSLNGLLGQRTPEKGYRGAPVIYDGRLTVDYGGGISQVSTTLFNAVFFSGAQIDEFHPHSFYISRYPEGREATISWPDVDNRFTNTTKGGIYIKASVDSDSITVTFYGQKTWDIEATKGPRVNIVPPRTIHDDKEGCVPQSPSDGFDVTIGRVFKKAGKVTDTTYFTTHYIPEDLVICG